MPAVVAVVAGVVGAVASGIGEAIGAVVGAVAGLSAGLSVASAVAMGIESLFFMDGLVAGLEAWATVAAIAEVILYKPPLKSAGSFQQFVADPQSPIPVIMGRFGTSGRAIYATSSGGGTQKLGSAGNQFISFCVILSGLGPIQDIEYFKANDTVVTIDNATDGDVTSGIIPAGTFTRFATSYTTDIHGNAVDNRYVGKVWMTYQLGNMSGSALQPTPSLTAASAALTEWDGTHKLSSFAASFYSCLFDSSIFAGQAPKPKWTLKGYNCYDPRKDSTYPGGSGTQRWATRSTWAYSANPFIHALNFLLGFWYPLAGGGSGLYLGAGVPMAGVDVAAFVAAANVTDANNWTTGGGWTSEDDKFNVFTNMLAAGSGVPIIGGGQVSCMVNTPLTSLGTITQDQLAGPVSIDTTTSMRDRINAVYPRFHSEPFDWDLITPLTPVTNSNYLADDGGRVKSKTITYEFCTNVNQAASLGAYDMANVREGIVVTLPGKPCLGAYPVGSAVTINLPQLGLGSFKAVVTKRQTNFQTGGINLTVRSETDAKHAWALGQTLTPPGDPQIGGADVVGLDAPSGADWTCTGVTLTDPGTGSTFPAIQVEGFPSDNPGADQIVIVYRLTGGSNPWLTESTTPVSGLTGNLVDNITKVQQTGYDVGVAYVVRGVQTPYLIFTDVTPGAFFPVVGTPNLLPNTVNNPVAALSGGTVTLSSSATIVQTAVITTIGGLVAVKASAVYWSGDVLDGGTLIGVYRDGVELRGAGFVYNQILMFLDDPPAGTHTYTLQASSTHGATIADTYLEVNEMKDTA